ncbi:S9 family peptidase [Aliidiomarina minuta]|nr:S9 family peptidase [Aliidiomarina minuta]
MTKIAFSGLYGCLLAASIVSASAAGQRAITAEDYYQTVDSHSPLVSPSGEQVIFVRTHISENQRSRHSNLWLADTSSALSARQFTWGDSDRAAAWSPDGRYLTFISNRDNGSALYKIRVAGGESQSLLQLKQGSLVDYKWATDGDSLLVSISLQPDIEDPLTEKEDSDDKADVQVARHAVYKTQGRYRDESLTSLWRYQLDEQKLVPLTLESGFNEGEPSFSPQGTHIAFSSNRHPDAFEGAFSQSLFIIDPQGEQQQLNTPDGHNSQPLWLSDDSLVFIHRAEPYAAPDLYRYNLQQNQSELIKGAMDLAPNNLQVANGMLYFTADNQGSHTLHQLDPGDGEISRLSDYGYSLHDMNVSQSAEQIVLSRHHEAKLPELYAFQSGDYLPLTDFNQSLQDQLSLERYQTFTVQDSDGHAAQAYFLPPTQFEEGQQYPLILNIKGGPGGMWGHQWMQEMQLMAARGYAVVFVNYRGSSGFGHDFAQQVRLDYGGADYRDNMLALETALEQYPWLDTERLYITGGSHGGFLTNWITTQSDRFRAAVTQRSVSNWLSEAGTQAFPPASMRVEFGGTIWENFDYYWDRSPLKYADQVTTPTLIIHSTDDHITPIGQGEEWFYALKANDVETELVVFQGEGHGLSRSGTPINLVERLNRIIDWFDKHP